jgi:hypothetical protein
MKRRWYIIPIAILLVCVVCAFAVRTTYTDTTGDLSDFQYSAGADLTQALDTLGEKDAAKVPQKLADGADLIVQAKFGGDRSVTPNAAFAAVQITQVYKGSANMCGKQIYVLEDMVVHPEPEFHNIMTAGCYIPLQMDDTYLLYLKRVQFQPARKQTEFQKSQYYPYTQSALGAFRITNTKQTKLFSSTGHYQLKDYSGCDLPAGKLETIDFYNKVRAQVFAQWKISARV